VKNPDLSDDEFREMMRSANKLAGRAVYGEDYTAVPEHFDDIAAVRAKLLGKVEPKAYDSNLGRRGRVVRVIRLPDGMAILCLLLDP